MIKRVAAGAFVGWAGIVGLAWWLAARRIEICDYVDERCRIAATAARDNALIWGLSIGLVAAIIFALILARRYGWGSWRTRSEQIELWPVRPAYANSRPFLTNKRSAPWISTFLALLLALLVFWQSSWRDVVAGKSGAVSVDETLTTENVVAGPFNDLLPMAVTNEAWKEAPLAQPAKDSTGQADTTVSE